jgi:alanine racemase
MEWKTKVTAVRTIERGDAVSYSRRFIAEQPTVIATLGIGYADGLSRALSNKGYVLINGCKAPIVGSICMDQMMVDVAHIHELAAARSIPFAVAPGTEAVIIGRSGKLDQTADDIAEAASSCMHEVLSTIGLRVERYYR